MIELPERPRGSAPYFGVTVVLEQTDNQLQRRAVLEAPERPDGSHADRPIRVARQLAQPRNRFGLLGITKSEDRRDFRWYDPNDDEDDDDRKSYPAEESRDLQLGFVRCRGDWRLAILRVTFIKIGINGDWQQQAVGEVVPLL